MPTSTTSASIPSYRLHKRRGQAIVRLSGRMFYLGPFGSPESHERYNEVVAQWLANGRCWPVKESPKAADHPYTVTELICDYWQHAQKYYVKGWRAHERAAGHPLRAADPPPGIWVSGGQGLHRAAAAEADGVPTE